MADLRSLRRRARTRSRGLVGRALASGGLDRRRSARRLHIWRKQGRRTFLRRRPDARPGSSPACRLPRRRVGGFAERHLLAIMGRAGFPPATAAAQTEGVGAAGVTAVATGTAPATRFMCDSRSQLESFLKEHLTHIT